MRRRHSYYQKPQRPLRLFGAVSVFVVVTACGGALAGETTREGSVFYAKTSCLVIHNIGDDRLKAETKNIDYCGIVYLLRSLVQHGVCTQKEAKEIASRIASRNDVSVIFYP